MGQSAITQNGELVLRNGSALVQNLSVEPEAIAPQYDSTQTYSIDDMVMYNGLLYKCTTAISTAEDWNSAHWTATDVVSMGTGKYAHFIWMIGPDENNWQYQVSFMLISSQSTKYTTSTIIQALKNIALTGPDNDVYYGVSGAVKVSGSTYSAYLMAIYKDSNVIRIYSSYPSTGHSLDIYSLAVDYISDRVIPI